MKPCEICGQPAQQVTVDAQEMPEQNGFRCWEPVNKHFRCARHKRRPKQWKLVRDDTGAPRLRDGEYIREQEF